MTPDRLDDLLAGGVVSHLQPVVDLARGNVAGYEALARFAGGPGPFEVFALARGCGRGPDVEAAALRAALTARSELPPNTFLTVNLGPDVLDTPQVQEALAEYGALDGVVIELTEQVRIESYAALARPLDRIRGLGGLIAVDDAGAGYAGLQHLLALRPDFIKLDRELVAGIDGDEAKRALAEVMGTFADRIDAWLIAEGVETSAELDVLVDLRVPLAQGYLLARPAPGFQSLDPDLALQIVGRATTPPGQPLRGLLEQTSVVPRDRAGDVPLAAGEIAVVVDAHGRPEATVDADGMTRAMRDTGLRVNLDTPVTDAAQRAIVRAPALRFQPLVCIDSAGRYVGIVRIERLIEALVRSA